jgi:hypothetical protein
MRLALEVQDIRALVAIGGISFALTLGASTSVFATPFATLSDADRDGLSNKIEVKITKTNPHDADTNNDGIKDGDEDIDEDGLDNTDELWLGTKLNDADSDNDGTADGDEDKDHDGIDNEDEDDLAAYSNACAPGVEDDTDEDSDGDDLDDEDEDDFGDLQDDPDSDDDGTADGDEDDEDEDDDCDGEADR